jgi:hypothetical protein
MIADLNLGVLRGSTSFDGNCVVCLFRHATQNQLYVADQQRFVKISFTLKEALKGFTNNSTELCMFVKLVSAQIDPPGPGVSGLTALKFTIVSKRGKWPDKVPKPPLPVISFPPPRASGQLHIDESLLSSRSRAGQSASAVSVLPADGDVVEIARPPPTPASGSRSLGRVTRNLQGSFTVHARVCYVSRPTHVASFAVGKDPFDVTGILLNGGNNLLTRLSIYGEQLALQASTDLILERIYEFTSVRIEKSKSKNPRLPGVGWNLSGDANTRWKSLDISIPRDCTIEETFDPFPDLDTHWLTRCCDVCGILLSLTPPLLTQRDKIFRKAAIAISSNYAVLVMIWEGLVVSEIGDMRQGSFIGIKNVVFSERREGEQHVTMQVTDASFLVKQVAGAAFERFAKEEAQAIRNRYEYFMPQLQSMKMSMVLDCMVDDVLYNLRRTNGYRSFRLLGLISSIDGASGNQLHYMGCDEPGCSPKKILVDPETKLGTCPKCKKVNGRTKPVPFARITIQDFIGAINIHVLFRETLFEKLFRCSFADYCRMVEGGANGEERKMAMIDRTLWGEVLVVIKHSPPADSFPEKMVLEDLEYPTIQRKLEFIQPICDAMETEYLQNLPIESQVFSE